MPTFKAVVDTSAKRKDGTMNVKIRVTHQRKTLKVATSIYVDSTQVTRSGKFKDERVIDMCDDIVRKWRKLASQLGTAEELSVADVVRFIREVEKRESFSLDFIAYGRKAAEGMNKGTARTYTTALNALCRFVGSDKLDIRHITVRFLEEFEKFVANEPAHKADRHGKLHEQKRTKEGGRAVSSYLGCVRALHNRAKFEYNDEDRGVILIPLSPFNKYKVKQAPRSKNKAVELKVVQALADLADNTSTKVCTKSLNRANMARDMFLLSFGLAGMNSADIWALRKSALKGDIITYERAKTASRRADRAEMSIRIEPQVMPLVERWLDHTDSDRLFVFGRYYADAQAFNTAINQGLKVCLAELRKVEGLEGLGNLTHYMARHTWATLARSALLNIDKYTVHEALNHIDNTMRVTDIYISRDWSNIWNANAKVVGLVDWSAML